MKVIKLVTLAVCALFVQSAVTSSSSSSDSSSAEASFLRLGKRILAKPTLALGPGGSNGIQGKQRLASRAASHVLHESSPRLRLQAPAQRQPAFMFSQSGALSQPGSLFTQSGAPTQPGSMFSQTGAPSQQAFIFSQPGAPSEPGSTFSQPGAPSQPSSMFSQPGAPSQPTKTPTPQPLAFGTPPVRSQPQLSMQPDFARINVQPGFDAGGFPQYGLRNTGLNSPNPLAFGFNKGPHLAYQYAGLLPSAGLRTIYVPISSSTDFSPSLVSGTPPCKFPQEVDTTSQLIAQSLAAQNLAISQKLAAKKLLSHKLAAQNAALRQQIEATKVAKQNFDASQLFANKFYQVPPFGVAASNPSSVPFVSIPFSYGNIPVNYKVQPLNNQFTFGGESTYPQIASFSSSSFPFIRLPSGINSQIISGQNGPISYKPLPPSRNQPASVGTSTLFRPSISRPVSFGDASLGNNEFQTIASSFSSSFPVGASSLPNRVSAQADSQQNGPIANGPPVFIRPPGPESTSTHVESLLSSPASIEDLSVGIEQFPTITSSFSSSLPFGDVSSLPTRVSTQAVSQQNGQISHEPLRVSGHRPVATATRPVTFGGASVGKETFSTSGSSFSSSLPFGDVSSLPTRVSTQAVSQQNGQISHEPLRVSGHRPIATATRPVTFGGASVGKETFSTSGSSFSSSFPSFSAISLPTRGSTQAVSEQNGRIVSRPSIFINPPGQVATGTHEESLLSSQPSFGGFSVGMEQFPTIISSSSGSFPFVGVSSLPTRVITQSVSHNKGSIAPATHVIISTPRPGEFSTPVETLLSTQLSFGDASDSLEQFPSSFSSSSFPFFTFSSLPGTSTHVVSEQNDPIEHEPLPEFINRPGPVAASTPVESPPSRPVSFGTDSHVEIPAMAVDSTRAVSSINSQVSGQAASADRSQQAASKPAVPPTSGPIESSAKPQFGSFVMPQFGPFSKHQVAPGIKNSFFDFSGPNGQFPSPPKHFGPKKLPFGGPSPF